MASINHHASKSDKAFRDFTQTPPWLFHAFDHRFNYGLDGAALPISALCEKFISPEQNSLTTNWSALLSDSERPTVWVNPPYSNILPWVKKAVEQRELGVLTTLFVPHENRAEWWPNECASEIIDIVGYYKKYTYQSGKQKGQSVNKWVSGGIKFVNASTGELEKNELNKAMCVIVFDPMHTGACMQRTVKKNILMAIGEAAIARKKI
jgi:phage N-6-adenine-methyltransferase